MMDAKGYSLTSAEFLIVMTIVVSMLTILIVVKYFISFVVVDQLHETDRKLNDISENILTSCDLLAQPGIFSATKLQNALGDPLKERCYRYCDLGMLIEVKDADTNEIWKLGYTGVGYLYEKDAVTSMGSYKVGIYNESESNCPAVQSCSFPLKSDCQSNCCAWDSGQCKSCDQINNEVSCSGVELATESCSWNRMLSKCEYTMKTTTGITMHRGNANIWLFFDLPSSIGCAIEKAKITGKTQDIFVASALLPDVKETPEDNYKKIIVKSDSGKLLVTMPVTISGELGGWSGTAGSDEMHTYERYLYEGSSLFADTEIQIKGDTMLHVDSSGKITSDCISCKNASGK